MVLASGLSTLYLSLLFLAPDLSVASEPMALANIPFSESVKKRVLEGEIISESKVTSNKTAEGLEQQSMDFVMAGLHKKNCTFALRKLSQYENYKDYLSVVSASSYNQKTSRVSFTLTSPLLPIKQMGLDFVLPRITAPGIYPFEFDRGFLKNLHGEIHVSMHMSQCFFFTKAHWSGPHSGFPDMVLEFFSQALPKLSMERMFQVSNFY